MPTHTVTLTNALSGNQQNNGPPVGASPQFLDNNEDDDSNTTTVVIVVVAAICVVGIGKYNYCIFWGYLKLYLNYCFFFLAAIVLAFVVRKLLNKEDNKRHAIFSERNDGSG